MVLVRVAELVKVDLRWIMYARNSAGQVLALVIWECSISG